MTAVLHVQTRWVCPNCSSQDITAEPRAHSRFHSCAGLRGLTAPMVPAGTDCKVVAHDREDYVGRELVQTDGDGRPIMSITTEHADGRVDCVVFAPTARADARENQ